MRARIGRRPMQPKYLASLEFDKILSRAAQGIVCPEARGLLLEEQPLSLIHI